jgi:F-type H+-transporting ATPase subunit b
MPQLDFSYYISQLFWLTVSFGMIYLFVHNYVTKAIVEIKNKRTKHISDNCNIASTNEAKIAELQKIIESIKITTTVQEAELISGAKAAINDMQDIKMEEMRHKLLAIEEKSQIDLSHKLEALSLSSHAIVSNYVKCILHQVAGIKLEEQVISKYTPKK